VNTVANKNGKYKGESGGDLIPTGSVQVSYFFGAKLLKNILDLFKSLHAMS
jgi:hypothetical protein